MEYQYSDTTVNQKNRFEIGLLAGDYTNKMSVITMRQGLPNFFLDSKNTYSGKFASIEGILEPYESLSASNAIPCNFDIKLTVSNPEGSTNSEMKEQKAEYKYDFYLS